ncbi:MAG: DUF3006 domain-containing protein [Patescibacteria group bacterium]|nr:DUF3006 domain-containing protein [Patescibacteria group bacterium]
MNINLTIDRFEGKQAVLISKDKEIINWPKNKLPKNMKEGSVLAFTIKDNQHKSEDDKKLAKNILNEILNP